MDSRTTGLVMIAIAIVLFAVAVHLGRRALKLARAGGKARGTIVGSEKAYGSQANRPFYKPKVRFTGTDGREHTFVSPVGRGKPYVDGTEVGVVYDPAHPEEAEIAGFVHTWLVPSALAVFGAVILATGIGAVT